MSPISGIFVSDVKKVKKNEMFIKEDSITGLFKRVVCDEEEWEKVEETVKDSGMELDYILEQLKYWKGITEWNKKRLR